MAIAGISTVNANTTCGRTGRRAHTSPAQGYEALSRPAYAPQDSCQAGIKNMLDHHLKSGGEGKRLKASAEGYRYRYHQIARGTTLVTVNQQVGGSIGAAVLAVILTNQFNGNANITAANKMASLQQDAGRHGLAVDPSAVPREALTPDFVSHLSQGLAHAYTVVFVLAVVLVTSTIIPAAFLPRKPALHTATLAD